MYSSKTRLCFNIVTELNNWNESSKACHRLHPRATLVRIMNTEEQEVLQRAIVLQPGLLRCYKDGGTHFFTSGQRKVFDKCNATFVWRPSPDVPEAALREGNVVWTAGQPSCDHEGAYENCLDLWLQQSGTVNDINCEVEACSICQILI